MITLRDLKVGDELRAWMKTGFALKKARRKDGSTYRYCPAKATNCRGDDLTFWAGIIIANDVTNKLLTVQVALFDRFEVARSESHQAQVPYLAIKDLHLLSKVAFAGKPDDPLRPTLKGIGTGFHPYHTATRVELIW